jgi:MFS family permease
MTTMVTPGLAPLVENFHSSEEGVSTFIITAPTFWTGITAFVVVSGADIWGRRPFYVFSIALLACSNLLGYVATVCRPWMTLQLRMLSADCFV